MNTNDRLARLERLAKGRLARRGVTGETVAEDLFAMQQTLPMPEEVRADHEARREAIVDAMVRNPGLSPAECLGL